MHTGDDDMDHGDDDGSETTVKMDTVMKDGKQIITKEVRKIKKN